MWSGVSGLGSRLGVSPAGKNPKFYALRQRASLFGYNAVNPLMSRCRKLSDPAWRLLIVNSRRLDVWQEHDSSNLVDGAISSISTRCIRSSPSADGSR